MKIEFSNIEQLIKAKQYKIYPSLIINEFINFLYLISIVLL